MLEFEKLKTKLASLKKSSSSSSKAKPASAGQAPQPASLSAVASTSSISSSSKNRTFLGINSILYPKETKKPVAAQKKGRRAAVTNESAIAGAKEYLEVEGLKGYGKSGARVSAILSEMNAKTLLQKTQSGNHAQGKEKNRAMANVNEEILNKVEGMIATKKQPEKIFRNNPPRKEAPLNLERDTEELNQGWNPLFNQSKYR